MEQQTKANLAKAIINVMKTVKGIEKNSTVGSGSYQYKGVNDQDVKKIIGQAMAENGLCMIPIDVEASMNTERWVETYNGTEKQKQLVTTEVRTKYLLLHESGESQEVCGYGHGTDSLDKGAGKATTYALKYALLYTFLTPTGMIDDSDNTHSEEVDKPTSRITAPERNSDGSLAKPVQSPASKEETKSELKWLNKDTKSGTITKEWSNVIKGIESGKISSVQDVLKVYKISKPLQSELNETIQKLTIKAA